MKFYITLLLSLLVANGYDCYSLDSGRNNATEQFDPSRVIGEYSLGLVRTNGTVIAKPNNYYSVSIAKARPGYVPSYAAGPKTTVLSLEVVFVIGNTISDYFHLDKNGSWHVRSGTSTFVGVSGEAERIEDLIDELPKIFTGFGFSGKKVSLLGRGMEMELNRK